MSQEKWGRKEMIKAFHLKTSLSSLQCADVLEKIIEVIKEGLVQTGEVKIPGFATFQVYDRKAHKGRNPRTQEEKVVPVHKAIRFRRSRLLHKSLQLKA